MASEPPSSRQAGKTIAWAVWVGDRRDNRCVAVAAPDEASAREQALDEADDYDEVYHVDGPFAGGDPAVYEFEYVMEFKERVVVEAPTEDYAEENAEAEREYRGEYKRDVHTETRRIDKKEI